MPKFAPYNILRVPLVDAERAEVVRVAIARADVAEDKLLLAWLGQMLRGEVSFIAIIGSRAGN